MRRPDGLWRRLALAAFLAAVASAAAVPAGQGGTADPPSVVLVTRDCALREFVCPAFTRAARRTGTRARIVSPDAREDLTATFVLLGRQGHDLVIGDPDFGFQLADAAQRVPQARFAVLDMPVALGEGRPPNVAMVELRAREAAYLAGWLAGRMERERPGPDVVGAVGGVRIEPVEEFIVAFRAGALRASPRARVLVGYANSFTDPTACTVRAERQLAQGAGVLLDAAGGCGPGTLAAARSAGAFAVGADRDRSGLGPHILTSVVQRYDRAAAQLMRQARTNRLPADRAIVLGLRRGGAELGRISPRVPGRVLRELVVVRRAIARGTIRVPGGT